jgi:IS30 family transposase
MKEIHRSAIAAYVSARRYLREDCKGAKSLTQMAKQIGTTKSTVRRWLRRDHWALWMDHWASAEEIWEAERRDRHRLPQRERQARQLAAEQSRTTMVALLDCCLADLTKGAQLQSIV